MKIKAIIDKFKEPKLYAKGTDIMWTDEYISKQLLKYHLDPGIEAASRSQENIKKTIDWIKGFKKPQAKVLDLGCGPGLYCANLAELGYHVTGIDWSKTSIDYAKKAFKNLDIQFICDNYLDYNFDDKYDIIIMIFCDFGVLSINERSKILNKVNEMLEEDGIFIFDFYNENNLQDKTFNKQWNYDVDNFWTEKPHLYLSESIHYPNEKIILDQHLIIEDEGYKIYRFWEHYFNIDDFQNELKKYFSEVEFFQNRINNSPEITFCKVKKR